MEKYRVFFLNSNISLLLHNYHRDIHRLDNTISHLRKYSLFLKDQDDQILITIQKIIISIKPELLFDLNLKLYRNIHFNSLFCMFGVYIF